MASFDYETALWLDEMETEGARVRQRIRTVALAFAGIALILSFPLVSVMAAL